ncbi:hypothetical protein Peternella1_7 [Winogradskyella phage Peternella_1]|uniref:Uncharacterized protein n=1 Tax=Winogradskyella phage Peternella_1 TaxID=2745699 RepID=A0A8E4ZDK1_9CAUD|nr:hypothetical protein M1M32_gp07 [Winogradskyella phage Peternella_1]QQV91543.1 hypothetical protein Peternella1_7 [Winogradskyella phage Peternella_1]
MTKGSYITHLLNILAYDSLIDMLSIAERYWLHREIIKNYGLSTADACVSNTPQGRILNISNKIISKNWQRPDLRYNSFRELEEFNGTEWITLNILNHV